MPTEHFLHPKDRETDTLHVPKARRLRILVVEDDDDTADSMALVLNLYGHDVHVARDGSEALQAASATHPDVVLLDLGLPGMDGWEVAKQLRQRASGTRPYLIAVSGYGHPEARRRSEEAGIDRHLLKPVDPEELQALLRPLSRLPESALCTEPV